MNFFRNPWAIVLLVLLVVLLFGAGKLPGLARNLGKSMRIFKSEVEELRGEDRATDEDEDDRRARGGSSRARDDREDRYRDDRDDRHREDRDDRYREDRTDRVRDREFDPRDDVERETVRPREGDDSYRRD